MHYARLMDFVVAPDGRRILAYPLNSNPDDTLQAFLFGTVFSFALLKLGIEQLHATGVVINERAVGFLGDTGFGKSSLAAAFVQRGISLLTDDLLVIQIKNDRLFAQPGLPRLKVLPDTAETLNRGIFSGKIVVNAVTGKQMIGLGGQEFYATSVPLQALYSLRPTAGESDVRIERLYRNKAFVEICAATFNSGMTETDRLKEQFRMASRIATSVATKKLSYPHRFEALPEVCDSIIADIMSDGGATT